MRTMQRDVAVAFLFSADGKLLLGKGGIYADTWLVPGGGIEPGEGKEAALRREVLEETGIDIAHAQVEALPDSTGKSEKTLRDTGERVLVEMTFYNYKITLREPADAVTVITEDDFTAPKWASPQELARTPLPPPTIVTLRRIGVLL